MITYHLDVQIKHRKLSSFRPRVPIAQKIRKFRCFCLLINTQKCIVHAQELATADETMENANICYSVKYLQCACMGNVFAFLGTLYSYAVYYCSRRELLFHLTGALKRAAFTNCLIRMFLQTATVSELSFS